ncbi:hypothetical protein LPJ81_001874 [Coemansia sp. IMI 209127]|nr:hypothetical protein LPJ81_001874 [Coemansia sp. IMI 209127]
MSNKTSPLANIDSAELELLLSRKLQDPTPTVLRKDIFSSTYETPRRYSLHKKHSMVPPLQSDTVFPCPTPFPDPPQRKESNVYRHKLLAKPNFADCQPTLAKSTASTSLPSRHSKDRSVHVVRELVATEKTYVSDIEALVSAFTMPLCDYAYSKKLLLDNMLHPLQLLLLFQRRFLLSLVDIADTNVFAVAQLFCSESPGFRIYIEYSVNFHQINSVLDKLEDDATWRKLVGKSKEQVNYFSGQHQLGLRDLLIRPVQRICKYPLFLSELLKYTAKESNPHTCAELSRSLSIIKGICVGIDKEQHRGEAMRLCNAILDSYCDNQRLPASFVARLGTVSLSGLLTIHSSSTGSTGAVELVGCVLFKRFIIIFTFRKPRNLFPQYWFPMHTMTLVDDGTANEYSWQLQHLKSGQFMRFSARSMREKDLWQRKLREAISVSIKMTPQQHLVGHTSDRALLQPTPATQQKEGNSTSHHVGKAHGHNNRLVWYRGSTPTRETESEFERFFKSMTSPEIIRANTLERLQHSPPVAAASKFKGTEPAPQFPVPSFYSAISSSFGKASIQRHTNSHGSGKAEAATSSETTGILYLQSPCHFQHGCKCRPDQSCFCSDCKKNNTSSAGHCLDPSTSHSRGTVSGRLLGILDHLSPAKPNPAHISTSGAEQWATYNAYRFYDRTIE